MREVVVAVVQPGMGVILTTYEAHTFAISFQEDSHAAPGAAPVTFTKASYDEILTITYHEINGFSVESTHPFPLMETQLESSVAQCPDQTHPGHASCIAAGTFGLLQSQMQHQHDVIICRDRIADTLHRYICADDNFIPSAPLTITREIVHDKEIAVEPLLLHANAKIWTLRQFVMEEECALLMGGMRGEGEGGGE